MDWAAFATTYMQNSTYTNDANDIIYSSIISLALAIQMMMSFFFFRFDNATVGWLFGQVNSHSVISFKWYIAALALGSGKSSPDTGFCFVMWDSLRSTFTLGKPSLPVNPCLPDGTTDETLQSRRKA